MRPEITGPARQAPLHEAAATGADVMATICTGCQQSFAPLEPQYPFEVRSYISLVAEAVGVRREDRFKKYVTSGDISKVVADAQEYIDASDFSPEELGGRLQTYFHRFCSKHGQSLP